MLKAELTVGEIISGGMEIGKKNILSYLGAIILWGLTIWIPLINIGTTIALITLPAKLSKEKAFSPLEIFEGKYRKYIGEYAAHWFLTFISIYLLLIISLLPFMLFIAPIALRDPNSAHSLISITLAILLGSVSLPVAISWTFSNILLIDKQLSPAEALTASTNLIYGYKTKTFFSFLILCVIYLAPTAFFIYLLNEGGGEVIGSIIIGVLLVLWIVLCKLWQAGMVSYIYKKIS